MPEWMPSVSELLGIAWSAAVVIVGLRYLARSDRSWPIPPNRWE